MKDVLAVMLGLMAAGLQAAQDFTGTQVLRIPTDLVPSSVLESLVADVWGQNRNYTDVFVKKTQLPRLKNFLRKNHIEYDVMIKNVQAMITQERMSSVGHSDFVRRKGGMMFHKYNKLNVIHDYLDHLSENYSDFVTVGVMGYSHQKRPLKYIKISSGKPEAKAFFIDGGIHAREWISPAVSIYLVRELVENRAGLPQDLLDVDFYIVPVLNPDGYHYTFTTNRLWRKNRSKSYNGCRGVDLNRNFGYKWGGKGSSGKGCSEVFKGKAPLSEPESKALADFVSDFSHHIKVYLSLHSYSQLILLPFSYSDVQPDNFNELKAIGDEAAEAMLSSGGEIYTVGSTPQILYPAGGSSMDWAAGEAGIKYSFTMELRDTGRYGFLLPAKMILPTAKEVFHAVRVMAKALR